MRADNLWATKSTWRRRLATCGRTNSAILPQNRSWFSQLHSFTSHAANRNFESRAAFARTPKSGQEPCYSCEKGCHIGQLAGLPHYPRTVTIFNHNFHAPPRYVSAITGTTFEARQGNPAPYLCLKMMSSTIPYSFAWYAFMMKSRSTSRSTFSSGWPLCLESNWLVISRMRRISRA